MRYPIAIEIGNDRSAWGVAVPDLKGCYSAGDSLDEALANVQEAVALWFEDNEGVPDPSPLAQRVRDGDYKGWTWMLIDFDLEKLLGPSERINITVPKRALERIDVVARESGESRSGFLVRAALEKVAGRALHRSQSDNTTASTRMEVVEVASSRIKRPKRRERVANPTR